MPPAPVLSGRRAAPASVHCRAPAGACQAQPVPPQLVFPARSPRFLLVPLAFFLGSWHDLDALLLAQLLLALSSLFVFVFYCGCVVGFALTSFCCYGFEFTKLFLGLVQTPGCCRL